MLISIPRGVSGGAMTRIGSCCVLLEVVVLEGRRCSWADGCADGTEEEDGDDDDDDGDDDDDDAL